MSGNEKPTAGFVLSLIAGILILINGAVIGALGAFLSSIPGLEYFGGLTSEEAAGLAFVSAFLYIGTAIGVIFGLLVLIGAIMVYRNPSSKTGWGVVILLFSIFSIVIGGGFLIGFILGIIGGALTLAWKPKTPST